MNALLVDGKLEADTVGDEGYSSMVRRAMARSHFFS